MEPENLERTLDEISTATERARLELDRVDAQIAAARGALAEAPTLPEPVPEPMPEPTPLPTPPPVPEPTPDPVPDPIPAPEVLPEPTPLPSPGPEPEAPAAADDGAARLVAMKMAIDGSSRDQIESELAGKFGSADRGALLDEVFSRAGR